MSITVKKLSKGLERAKKIAEEEGVSKETTVLLELNGAEKKIDITVNPPNIPNTFSLNFGDRQIIEHSFVGDVEDDLLEMGFI